MLKRMCINPFKYQNIRESNLNSFLSKSEVKLQNLLTTVIIDMLRPHIQAPGNVYTNPIKVIIYRVVQF